jgi:hypothetical protein
VIDECGPGVDRLVHAEDSNLGVSDQPYAPAATRHIRAASDVLGPWKQAERNRVKRIRRVAASILDVANSLIEIRIPGTNLALVETARLCNPHLEELPEEIKKPLGRWFMFELVHAIKPAHV